MARRIVLNYPLRLLAFLLLAAPPLARADDKLTLEASYPSPSGVYDTLHTKKYQFIAYQTRAEMNNPPMPSPGIFVYCKETDSYYASSGSALPADPTTWWFRLVLDNTPENIYAEGSMDFLQPNNSYAWTKPLTVTTGKLYYYNDFVRSTIKITSAGSYNVAATGRLCEVLPPGSTHFVGPSASTAFKLQIRFNATRPVAEQTSFTLGVAPDQANDCFIDPADITPAPSPVPQCFCAPFSMNASMNLPDGNYPYAGILAWGAKTGAWSTSKHYGGYVVHVDDLIIYK